MRYGDKNPVHEYEVTLNVIGADERVYEFFSEIAEVAKKQNVEIIRGEVIFGGKENG